jgi:poly-gamma-glutamate system protein
MKKLLRLWGDEMTYLLWGSTPFPRKLAFLGLFFAAFLGVLPLLDSWPPEAARAVYTTTEAQRALHAWRGERGIASPVEEDPLESGLIGVEWSILTTTLGDLEAKQTASDPRWAGIFTAWYREMGLGEGSRIALICSGSFPGLMLSALAAAEQMKLEILLLPSLGSSTWGANREDLSLLDILAFFRSRGFLQSSPQGCSLGGGGDTGGGLSKEGRTLLEGSAEKYGVPLLSAPSLEKMIALKGGMIREFQAQGLVSIGGSAVSLGEDPEVLKLPPGLLLPSQKLPSGRGLIGWALREGLPVLHLLNLRELSRQQGLPYAPTKRDVKLPSKMPRSLALGGLLLFFGMLICHKRWEHMESGLP